MSQMSPNALPNPKCIRAAFCFLIKGPQITDIYNVPKVSAGDNINSNGLDPPISTAERHLEVTKLSWGSRSFPLERRRRRRRRQRHQYSRDEVFSWWCTIKCPFDGAAPKRADYGTRYLYDRLKGDSLAEEPAIARQIVKFEGWNFPTFRARRTWAESISRWTKLRRKFHVGTTGNQRPTFVRAEFWKEKKKKKKKCITQGKKCLLALSCCLNLSDFYKKLCVPRKGIL